MTNHVQLKKNLVLDLNRDPEFRFDKLDIIAFFFYSKWKQWARVILGVQRPEIHQSACIIHIVIKEIEEILGE